MVFILKLIISSLVVLLFSWSTRKWFQRDSWKAWIIPATFTIIFYFLFNEPQLGKAIARLFTYEITKQSISIFLSTLAIVLGIVYIEKGLLGLIPNLYPKQSQTISITYFLSLFFLIEITVHFLYLWYF